MKGLIILDNFILYTTDDGLSNVKLYAQDGTVWLTQKGMSELFSVKTQAITKHINNIYSEGELLQESTCSKMEQVQIEGFRQTKRLINFYNLDMILAVGFRVRSTRGTQFRQWANTTLKEYLVKGFVIDSERLKNPDGRPDYFDELLEKIRDIRASEKRFYQKLRDLFALSSDYTATEQETKLFYAQVQNKLLYGITGMTAAELITKRANSDSPNMALTSWEGTRVRKKDVTIAKNYLTSDEIDSLNRLVTIFLESAEFRVKMNKVLTLKFWQESTDALLSSHVIPLLNGKGKISHRSMVEHVHHLYDEFDNKRKHIEAKEADKLDMLEAEIITIK